MLPGVSGTPGLHQLLAEGTGSPLEEIHGEEVHGEELLEDSQGLGLSTPYIVEADKQDRDAGVLDRRQKATPTPQHRRNRAEKDKAFLVNACQCFGLPATMAPFHSGPLFPVGKTPKP